MNGAIAKVISADITNCDHEKIQIPGAILPHGAKLILEFEAADTTDKRATKASKYGAHSGSGGLVAIRGSLTSEGGIERALAPNDGKAPQSGPAITPPELVKPSGPGIRVLVVEDSFMTIGVLELVFETLGWTMVGPATRVAKALALVKSEYFDAVLMDVNLDGEMTWEVAAALQRRGIPFVFSTGYELNASLPEFLHGSNFIRKPYKIVELENSVLDILKHKSEK